MTGEFHDVIDANRAYAQGFSLGGLAPQAAQELAVLTCIDSRIEPLAMLGLDPGDAKIVRNAGARVSDDALRSLVLAANLLAVRRIMVIAHTDCAMTGTSDEEIHAQVAAVHGSPPPGLDEFRTLAVDDPRSTLAADVERLRSCALLPPGVVVAGFTYDVETGLLHPLGS